jgi:hypothetical protein
MHNDDTLVDDEIAVTDANVVSGLHVEAAWAARRTAPLVCLLIWIRWKGWFDGRYGYRLRSVFSCWQSIMAIYPVVGLVLYRGNGFYCWTIFMALNTCFLHLHFCKKK